MRSIQTVSGSVRADDVGEICVHEHLILDMTHEAVQPRTEAEQQLFHSDVRMENLGVLRRNPYLVRTNLVLDDIGAAADEVRHVQACGCNLLVELTSVGLGRDVRKLRQISDATGMNIVAGCGLFVHDSRIRPYLDYSVDELADCMRDEIENGIEGTGIRAGVIGEIGTSEVIHPIERTSLCAAGKVGAEKDLPVYVHTYPWSRAGLEAVDLLLSCGVRPRRICVCHMDVSFDIEYLRLVLDRGVFVEFDNIGKEFYFESREGAFSGGPFETDVARAGMLRRLAETGYAGQLLVANDLCLKASLRRYGGWGYDHLFTNFIPMMRMEGMKKEDIRQITHINPRLFLFGDAD